MTTFAPLTIFKTCGQHLQNKMLSSCDLNKGTDLNSPDLMASKCVNTIQGWRGVKYHWGRFKAGTMSQNGLNALCVRKCPGKELMAHLGSAASVWKGYHTHTHMNIYTRARDVPLTSFIQPFNRTHSSDLWIWLMRVLDHVHSSTSIYTCVGTNRLPHRFRRAHTQGFSKWDGGCDILILYKHL